MEWERFWQQARMKEAAAASVRVLLALASVMAAGWALGQAAAVLPLLLGVIASALAETDDSWRGRLRAQLGTLLCFALMALAVQMSLASPWLLGAVLAAAALGLTLLGALGERYRAMAFATLVLAIYAGLSATPPSASMLHPLRLLLIGAAWHGLISVLWAAAWPMLTVRQNLAAVYETLGHYLALKAGLLEPVRGADLQGRRLALALHNGQVVQALNQCKESLFSRLGPGPGPAPVWLREALQAYLVAQDVHERSSSSHAQYEALAEAFFHSDVLYRAQRLLALLGQDCVALAGQIRRQAPWQRDGRTVHAIEDLQAALRHVEATAEPASLAALRGLAANLGALDHALTGALQPAPTSADTSLLDRQPRSLSEAWQRLRAECTDLSSPLLRHALRLSLALTAGYALMWGTGERHGFWILLTIVFVCQPGYGATLTRLAQRIWGTVLGLVVGWALLRLFPDLLLQSAFTVAAGVLFFAARHSRYSLATAAITALVLLSFNQAGDGFDLIVPRLLDTLAGSLIAGLAVWRVLPSWQAQRLHRLAAQTLRSQADYLREIQVQYRAGKRDHLAYRLARRNAHNADAALSRALAAMAREPAAVRRDEPAGLRFLALSHTLLNYLSALGAHRRAELQMAEQGAAGRAIAGLLAQLDAVAEALQGGSAPLPSSDELLQGLGPSAPLPEHQRLLYAQLALCLQLLPRLRQQAQALRDPALQSGPCEPLRPRPQD